MRVGTKIPTGLPGRPLRHFTPQAHILQSRHATPNRGRSAMKGLIHVFRAVVENLAGLRVCSWKAICSRVGPITGDRIVLSLAHGAQYLDERGPRFHSPCDDREELIVPVQQVVAPGSASVALESAQLRGRNQVPDSPSAP